MICPACRAHQHQDCKTNELGLSAPLLQRTTWCYCQHRVSLPEALQLVHQVTVDQAAEREAALASEARMAFLRNDEIPEREYSIPPLSATTYVTDADSWAKVGKEFPAHQHTNNLRHDDKP